MPPRRLPPRLWLDVKRDRWRILDAGRQTDTRCRGSDREGAEGALRAYLAAKWRPPAPDARGLTVSEALALYARERGPQLAPGGRATAGYAIDALARWWGETPAADVRGELCRRYARERGRSDGTVRRELAVLSAALRHCAREGYLPAPGPVWMPPPAPPRERCLTREEAWRLIWASRGAEHVYRFVVLGLLTGTRKDALMRLQWLPSTTGGWIDLDGGLLYRRGVGIRETSKRQPPARLPQSLLRHLRVWRARSRRFVIEHRGQPVASVRTAWRNACARAGLDDVTPHTLRHTMITWAMTGGARPVDVASYAGVSMQIIERVYLHLHPDHQRSVTDALSGRNR